MFKHILVPTDGSELSQATAKRAVSFAKEAGARVTVFFAMYLLPQTSHVFSIRMLLLIVASCS